MQLTYVSHLHTAIQAVLDVDETLGGDPDAVPPREPEFAGPGVFYVKCDGTSAAYAEIREKELDVIDPLDTPAIAPILEAQREAKAAAEAEAAEAARAGNETHKQTKAEARAAAKAEERENRTSARHR